MEQIIHVPSEWANKVSYMSTEDDMSHKLLKSINDQLHVRKFEMFYTFTLHMNYLMIYIVSMLLLH